MRFAATNHRESYTWIREVIRRTMEKPRLGGSERLFSFLYFGGQSIRNGVRKSNIRCAQELLNSSSEVIREHVRSRLVETHGAPEPALHWLDHQPTTDRTALHDLMDRSIEAHPRGRIEVRKTSGSTGAPFRFVKDRKMTAMMDAVMWAAYAWHGIEPGQRHARFWGMPRDPVDRTRRHTMDLLLHRRRLDALELSPHRARHFHGRLRDFRPRYIHAYPNLLLEFIEYCAEEDMDGRKLGVETVVCGGELLSESSRQTIGEYFGATVVNEYGCSESGLISIDCEHGQPHMLPVAVYPQLIDVETTSRNSDSGEVVITDLYGSIAPLLRYRLHDRAEIFQEQNCACGRDLASLSPRVGRVDSFITTPARGRVYDAILAYSVPSEVLRFRAYQIDISNLYVEVVLRAGVQPETVLRKLEATWERELGPGLNVNAALVEEIPTMESGKLAYFIPEGQVPPAVLARASS